MNILKSKSACIEFQKVELCPGFQVQADTPLAQIDGRDLYEILITSSTGIQTAIGTSDGQVLQLRGAMATYFWETCMTSMGEVRRVFFEGEGHRYVYRDGEIMTVRNSEVDSVQHMPEPESNGIYECCLDTILGSVTKVTLCGKQEKPIYVNKDGEELCIGEYVFVGQGYGGNIATDLKDRFMLCKLSNHSNAEMVDTNGSVVRIHGRSLSGIRTCAHPIGIYQVTFRDDNTTCIVDADYQPVFCDQGPVIGISEDLGEIHGFGHVTEFFIEKEGKPARIFLGGDGKQILGEGGDRVLVRDEAQNYVFKDEVFLKVFIEEDDLHPPSARFMRPDGTYLRISDKTVTNIFEVINTPLGDVRRIRFSDKTASYFYDTGVEVLFDGKRCSQMRNIGNGTLITLEDNTSFFIPKKPSTDGLKKRVGDSVNTAIPEED